MFHSVSCSDTNTGLLINTWVFNQRPGGYISIPIPFSSVCSNSLFPPFPHILCTTLRDVAIWQGPEKGDKLTSLSTKYFVTAHGVCIVNCLMTNCSDRIHGKCNRLLIYSILHSVVLCVVPSLINGVLYSLWSGLKVNNTQCMFNAPIVCYYLYHKGFL